MNNISIIIADDNKELTLMISEYLKQNGFNVTHAFNQGIELLNCLENDKVDLLILDICMPLYDGFSVLDEIKNNEKYNKPSKIMLLSALSSEDVISRASKYGVDYFLVKPIKLNNLLTTINNLFNLDSIDTKVDRLLKEAAISEHLSGYKYLKYAINECYKNPSLLKSVTKELYPQVASTFDSTIDRVERSIRNAIEQAYNQNNLNLVFDKKPTNSSFIKYILDKIE